MQVSSLEAKEGFLVLARAIAMKPKLLMLDEPAAGLSPVNVDNLMKIIMQLKESMD